MYHGYHILVWANNTWFIVHTGITTDLERRTQEHRGKWPSCYSQSIASFNTEQEARAWENEMRQRGFPTETP